MKARYNYRLRVKKEGAAKLQAVFDTNRWVWNQALGRWGELWREEGLSYSYRDMDKELTDWRGAKEWLGSQPSVPQQQVLRDLAKSVSAFFYKDNPAGRPRFKKKRGGYSSARWTKRGFSVSGDRLEVAVEGGRISLRVVWSRPLPSEPSMVTVQRDKVGHWWASFVVEVQVPEPGTPKVGTCTGLDVGLETFATTEHPEHDIANPRFARRAAKAIARSQRAVSRKKKGSKNRARAKHLLAREHARVANQRSDFQHKASRELVSAYSAIGVEKLRAKNMARRGKPGNRRRKTGLNRAISDASWASFLATLSWQAAKAGATVVTQPAAWTTQTCSSCGARAKPRVELSDRVFSCCSCGLVLGRDRNSARNLNPARYLGLYGGTEPVRDHTRGDEGTKPSVPAGTLAA